MFFTDDYRTDLDDYDYCGDDYDDDDYEPEALLVTFQGFKSEVKFLNYGNGNTAIQLIGAPTSEYPGEPIATASINFDALNSQYLVYIKDWSENEGMAEVLEEAGYIRLIPNHSRISGHVVADLYEITGWAATVLADY